MADLTLLPVEKREHESLEYVRAVVEPARDGAEFDPSTGSVEFAFLTGATRPLTGDWKTGDWEQVGSRWIARINVGPGGTTNPGAGTWSVWVRLDLDPERPVREIGTLVVS